MRRAAIAKPSGWAAALATATLLFAGCTDRRDSASSDGSDSTSALRHDSAPPDALDAAAASEPKIEHEPGPDEIVKKPERAAPTEPSVEPRDASLLAAVDKSANPTIRPGDWPQWGGTSYRNNIPETERAPTAWDIGEFDRKTGAWLRDKAKNIKWVASLGDTAYGNPVVAGGKVYVGSNNSAGYLKRYPRDFDVGCLLCFRESDGAFLWQHSSEKLPSGNSHDWELQGICCAPCVEGDRLWFVTSRGEVRCLDTEGFYDGEDDGPAQKEWGRLFDVKKNEDADQDELAPVVAELEKGAISDALRQRFEQAGAALPDDVKVETAEKEKKWLLSAEVGGALRQFELRLADSQLSAFKQITPDDRDEADVVWVCDMMGQLGVLQHNMCSCSVTTLGDILFVNTSNGVDDTDENVPAPDAPSFLAMDKHSGEVLWSDNSPGANILHGQWSSPAAGVLGGEPQVVFAGGDGWVYSFRADKGKEGKPELLWKFDCNPKDSKWNPDGSGSRNNIIATPVIYDGLVYVAVGRDPEQGDGVGRLWCINPTKRGDVSPELAVHKNDRNKPIPHRRRQAVIPEQGEIAVENPNSAAIWCYSQRDRDSDGTIDFEEEMHRTMGMACIRNDLLFIADFSGLLHCLNAKTGDVYWTHDLFASTWGSPMIAAGHVYIGDEDGDVAVFRFSSDPKTAMKEGKDADELTPISEIQMAGSIYSTPVVANGVLFISARDKLFAIQEAPGAAQ